MEIHYKNNGHSFKAAVIHSITPKPENSFRKSR